VKPARHIRITDVPAIALALVAAPFGFIGALLMQLHRLATAPRRHRYQHEWECDCGTQASDAHRPWCTRRRMSEWARRPRVRWWLIEQFYSSIRAAFVGNLDLHEEFSCGHCSRPLLRRYLYCSAECSRASDELHDLERKERAALELVGGGR
jgi:hypothetical protein